MTKEKYALLDTDFISKTHLIRKDGVFRGKFHTFAESGLFDTVKKSIFEGIRSRLRGAWGWQESG